MSLIPQDRSKLSPMMQQYLSMKDEHRDQILMFRLGDFYEMFFDDAVTASRELELTLTGRDCGLPDRAPMCGVPYHSVENYIARLVKKGYKVAICEQMENPALAKGMVKRDIVRVVTPGTLMEANMLEEGSNNYICSLCPAGERCGLAFADISTGSVLVTEVSGEMAAINELGKYAPHEVIYAEELPQLRSVVGFLKDRLCCAAQAGDRDAYTEETAKKLVTEQFGADTVTRLGGDEFAVLLEDLAQPQDAARVAMDIIGILSEPWRLANDAEVRLGASLGISLHPEHGLTAEDLLQQADAALYQAKQNGRNRVEVAPD